MFFAESNSKEKIITQSLKDFYPTVAFFAVSRVGGRQTVKFMGNENDWC